MAIGRSRALRWTTANPHRIALVKVDVEEHEVSVIRGMRNLIERDHPILDYRRARRHTRSSWPAMVTECDRKLPDPSIAGLVYVAAHMPDAGENKADDERASRGISASLAR
jgi:hypothetical protein